MSDSKQEQFNVLTRKIIEFVVNECPVPVQITADTFELPKGEYQASGMIGFYKNTPQEEVLKCTLKWLEAENFIREKGGYYVATLQTLKLYNSVPAALSE